MMEPFTFSTLIPQGFKMLPATLEESEYGHALFGAHDIEGGWCPNCEKPLLHLSTIDTRDPRLGLTHLSLTQIPLLYCTRCAICWADGDVDTTGLQQHYHRCVGNSVEYSGVGCEFFYHIPSEKQIDILVYNVGYEEEYLPYPNFPNAFPGSGVKLTPITDEELWFCQRMNRYLHEHPEEYLRADYEAYRAFSEQYEHLNNWTHQLGGEPCFWNDPGSLACPCCGDIMPFLALIEDNESAGTPDMSGGEGGQITFHFCTQCSIIGAYVIGT